MAGTTDGLNECLKDDLDGLLNQPLNSAVNESRIKLLELVKNDLIKKYCCPNYTEEKINKMSELDIEQYHKIYLAKYNNELKKPIVNSFLNIYAHTVNRFKKLDSVDGLTEDLIKDPAIKTARNRVPSELLASLSLISAPVMIVAHT